ncbi:hypothetical protein GCM10009841_30730 [Microlunatus panaciterrae]
MHVALDETFDPVVGVCAVVVEQHYLDLNREVQELYHDLADSYYMDDLASFEKFVRDGFHKTADPFEVSTRFINYLSHAVGFNSYIIFSNRKRRPDLSDLKLVLMLYAETVRTIVERHRSRAEIVFHFEQHQQLNLYLEPLVVSVCGKIRGRKPKITVGVGAKKDPPLLAIADYVLHTFGSWWAEKGDKPSRPTDAADNRWRDMRAIRRSFSIVRSMEDGLVARRDLPDALDGTLVS